MMKIDFTIFRTVALLGLLGFISCSPNTDNSSAEIVNPKDRNSDGVSLLPLEYAQIDAHPLTTSGEPIGKFTEIASSESGVDFSNSWPDAYHSELPGSFVTAGIAVGDFNNDGLPDFFAARRSDGGRLYQNLGDFKFKDVTEEQGLDLTGLWGTGAVFADINNDGRLDLSVCGLDSANRMFVNLGDRFEDRASQLGLDYRGPSVVMSFCDYDRDGDLDAYLLTNRSSADPKPTVKDQFDESGRPVVPRELGEIIFYVRHPDGQYVRERAGRFDHLFRNEGDKFVNVTREARMSSRAFFGLSSTWWDYNDDGWPDLFVSNDFKGPDHLFLNNGVGDDGKVTFTDVATDAFPHTPWFSMGSDIADVNNDGRMDLMATDMAGTNHYRDKLSMGPMSGPDSQSWFLNAASPEQYMRNCLFLNSGTQPFMEAAYLAGLAMTDWTWTVRFADFDQDGWQDVYFTNGMSRDWFNGDLRKKARQYHDRAGGGAKGVRVGYEYWFLTPKYKLENLAFRNKGNLEFENVSRAWSLDHTGVSTGGATGDFDNDGDLDIVINGFDEPLRIYRNDVATGNCLKLYLQGRSSNRQAIGAKVSLEFSGEDGKTLRQLRYLNSTQGIMSSSESVAHFGVGEVETIDRVTIQWPSGIKQELENIQTNQSIVVTEPDEKISLAVNKLPERSTMFERQPGFFPAVSKHDEVLHDDFKIQPLLPNKYSQLGAGISWGDIDEDGDFDCFVGNGKGSLSRILVNEEGRLQVSRQDCFDADQQSEDMGSLFFDADSDGDLDLYVVSGNGEAEASVEFLQDRLYLNDGTGIFESATGQWLPELQISGSCVAGSDFDRDGDIDLFVGGRLVPGHYPTSPKSSVLVNSDGRFDDKTTAVAPEIAQAGMVTSAIWSDVNNDHWIDLLVTCEWGPVRLYLNSNGKLHDATSESGLDDYRGWYNSVSSGDIDNDGDIDFVVGNNGLNTKYYANDEKPELLYYGEFDDSGKKHIIEAKFEGKVCLPRRGLGCTSHAMPAVKKKLPTFHAFASSPLSDIYSSELISSAERFEVNNLESIVLINESKGESVSFTVKPLPRIAQISPVFGTSLIDIDGDSLLDLIVAQNFFGPQRETGQMDGGLSMLFRGIGNGEFSAIWPDESGIAVVGDATCLTIADLNLDDRPDFVVGINDEIPAFFKNCSGAELQSITVKGSPGNTNAIGCRLNISFADGRQLACDIAGGSSYLSQSPPVVFLPDKPVDQIDVVWSDGSRETITRPKFLNKKLIVTQDSNSHSSEQIE